MTTLTVSQINRYIKSLLDEIPPIQNVYVMGEISNFKHYRQSGHMYFTLKDSTSQLKCVMFSSDNYKLKFVPADGMSVVCFGQVGVYERDGVYQLYVRDIQPKGAGDLAVAFEQLKEKLQAKGYFDESIKKIIPRHPAKIGVATSNMGAAVEDIKNVISRRYPLCEIIICPTVVQGDEAPRDIASSIKLLDSAGVDVIIVGRGGGSIEDLWAFNTETVADAVFICKTPVISAVGHETDYTICDFVADLRAPTPSAAAELAVPNIKDVITKLKDYENRQKIALSRKLQIMKLRYEKCINSKAFKMPLQRINEKYMLIDIKVKQLEGYITKRYIKEKSKTLNLLTKLDGLSPLKTLTRGYGIITLNGKTIKSVKNLNKEDEINIKLYDGTVNAKILSKECD